MDETVPQSNQEVGKKKLRFDEIYDRVMSYTSQQYIDLCKMFADSEEFLIDGDALLANVVKQQGMAFTEAPRCPMSSLHVISRIEQILTRVSEMGGEYLLVFFTESRFSKHRMSLLRELVIIHFQSTTNVSVEALRFKSPYDPVFEKHVADEKPPFILTSPWSGMSKAFIIQYQSLGLDFAFMDGWQTTVVEIRGWYYETNRCRPPPEIVAMLKKAYSDKPQVSEIPPKIVHHRNEQPAWKWLAGMAKDVDCSETAHLLALMSVTQALKPHMGLADRVKDVSGRLPKVLDEGLQQVYGVICESGIVSGTANEVCDIIDELFLCQILSLLARQRKETSFFSLLTEKYVLTQAALESLKFALAFLAPIDLDQECPYSLWRMDDPVGGELCPPDNDLHCLVKIESPLYQEFTKGVTKSLDFEFSDDLEGRSFISREFRDIYHWHCLKKITDEFERIPVSSEGSLRAKQKGATFQVRYGISLEGKMTDAPIEVQSSKTSHPTKTATSSKSKKLEIMITQFREELKKYKEKVKKPDLLSDLKLNLARLDQHYRDCQNKLEGLSFPDGPQGGGKGKKSKSSNKAALPTKQDLIQEMQSVFVDPLTSLRIKLLDESLGARNPSDVQHKIEVLKSVKKILSYGGHPSEKVSKKLSKHIISAGFRPLIEELKELNLVNVDKVKGESPPDESLARFQMLHMGPFMEAEAPKDKDPRVKDFNPDLWQRELFNVVDKRGSALIVAPTSSGKTYASYYCMESVLRESNDGVVVYVSPTKALVNQIAATVCARFSKRKMNMPDGMHVYGVFTRDFRQDAMECQILVTIPECLEILLLSPTGAKWRKKVRYVIFDEVHNIGGESRGESWEHIINLIRCPFLALSATVENPETVRAWLQKSEDFKKTRDQIDGLDTSRSYNVRLVPSSLETKIQRHSDLKCMTYNSDRTSDDTLQALHPLTMVKESTVLKNKCLPGHISMSARECYELFEALESVLGPEEVSSIDPERIFGNKLLKRNDIAQYNQMVKTMVKDLILKETNDFRRVQAMLKGPGNPSLIDSNEGRFLAKEFPKLVEHLKEKNMLPAIAFAFNRKYCVRRCTGIRDMYEWRIENYLNSEKGKERAKAELKKEKREKKKLNDKPQLNATDCSDETSDRKSAEKLLRLGDAKLSRTKAMKMAGVDDGSGPPGWALEQLNDVYVKFPWWTLVTKHNLGEQDADFIMERLKGNADEDFEECLPYGISWHHAGNNVRMRNTTEMLFREKFLQVVAATTTLAQGIHMPCKTVIFMGDSPWLNSLNYHQCAGRAGRRGFDSEGNVIFLGVKENKISRLINSRLPLLIGNDPLSLSLVLRLFCLTSDEADTDALSRALCLLENPLIGVTQKSNPSTQLRLFFMYCAEFLARQSLIDQKGKSVGLAGFVSHLHYHEPYNLALVHLLQLGTLHRLCEKNKMGEVTEETMEKLMIVFTFLFARTEMAIEEVGSQKYGSKYVILPPLPPEVKKGLLEFQENMRGVFTNYIRSAAKMKPATTGTESVQLPLSKLRFPTGEIKANQSLISPFAALSGKTNQDVDSQDKMQTPDTNIRRDLLADTIPQIKFCELNAHVLDYFHHGVWRNLISDNKVPEGEVYNILNDFKLTLKTVETSLTEIGHQFGDKFGEHQILLDSIKAINDRFSLHFEESFSNNKKFSSHRVKGCIKSHPENCIVCHLIPDDQITEIKKRDKTTIHGQKMKGFTFRLWMFGLNCETRMVVYAVDCKVCCKHFVKTSVQPLAKIACQNQDLSILLGKHALCKENGKVTITIVQSCSNAQELEKAGREWMGKLDAEYLK